MSRNGAYVQFYVDQLGEYRWRLKAANHKIIADSAEGYKTKQGCIHGFFLVEEAFGRGEEIEMKFEDDWDR